MSDEAGIGDILQAVPDSAVPETNSPKTVSPGLKRPIEAEPEDEQSGDSAAALPPEQPRKKQKLKGADAEPGSPDEGEIIDSGSGSEQPSEPEELYEAPSQPSRGWNQGRVGGLRTSFATTATSGPSEKSLRKKVRGLETASPLDSQTVRDADGASLKSPGGLDETSPEQVTDKESSADSTPLDQSRRSANTSIAHSGRTWRIPSLRHTGIANHKSWVSGFELWCQQFIADNAGQSDLVTEAVILAAYEHYIRGMPKMHRRQRKDTVKALSKYARRGNLKELISKATLVPDGSSEDAPGIVATARAELSEAEAHSLRSTAAANLIASDRTSALANVPKAVQLHITEPTLPETMAANMSASNWASLHDGARLEELERSETARADESAYLQKYFSGSTPGNFCLLCGNSGHHYSECAELDCRFCDVEGHHSYACPTRARCTKCKQLGHTEDTCVEKLALAPGEETECAFCESKGHLEEACEEIWRSYCCNPSDVKKVKEIPIFCYNCGAMGHYGTECGLTNVNFAWSDHKTWSKINHDQYVDPASEDFAVCLDPRNALPAATSADRRPDFGGRPIAPRTHIFFSESESEGEEGFIRPSVNGRRPTQPGQIRFSTNAGNQASRVNGFRDVNNQNHRRNGAMAHQGQFVPPLPPGPPPPLPPPQNGPRRTSGTGFRGDRGGSRGRQDRRADEHRQPPQHGRDQRDVYGSRGRGRGWGNRAGRVRY